LILLSNNIIGKIDNQHNIGGLDIIIERNFFGSQMHSFINYLPYPEDFCKIGIYRAVFIRAPAIKNVYNDTQILAKCGENIVAVLQKNILGTSFHPELTSDFSWHEYFVNLVKKSISNK
jgi:5'-phosphate synthase pdxT subunit